MRFVPPAFTGGCGLCNPHNVMNNEKVINNIKKHVFFELLSGAGRVMILVRYSPDVVIGKRGFTDEEKKTGLTLAFNERMKFFWDDYGITASLAFGESSQKCFIPAGSIAAVYSPEMRAQLFTAAAEDRGQAGQSGPDRDDEDDDGKVNSGQDGENVINVDFIRRKRIKKEDSETEDV
jgi:hypothetical protein